MYMSKITQVEPELQEPASNQARQKQGGQDQGWLGREVGDVHVRVV
jgi:hypothetical protein